MFLNFILSGTHGMFCYTRILWLAQKKGPCMLLASGFLNSCLSDIHVLTSTWYTPYISDFKASISLSSFRKQAKMQWIQDPSQSNVDNLNNVRREVSRHLRNKKKAYLRAKIEELETNSKIQNIRDL